MSENLFDEFDPVSSKLWKQKIQYELKGAEYTTLLWDSPEGINVKPFYHIDEAKEPLAIGAKNDTFKIVQDIFVKDIEKSVSRAKTTLKRGAEALQFVINTPDTDIDTLLKDIDTLVSVYFYLQFSSIDFVKKLDRIAADKSATFYVYTDPIGNLVKTGNWFVGQDNFELLKTLNTSCKKINFLSINLGIYQNAGANIVQQIAYTLAHANEYFNRIADITSTITLQVSVGSNYFFEIAKLRALKVLFSLIANEYGYKQDCHIVATPTRRNKTLYDYNTNMLRTTTECMSAILGGADAVLNQPYDVLYHKSNEFADRLSRNQLLILKNESYFDAVNNPADGSYYIEELTRQLADRALELFKDIEAQGGFLKQLKDGVIQRKIQESATKEQELFDTGKEVLTGTNKYPNPKDRMSEDIQLYPFVKNNPRKTLISPAIEKRLAEKLEQQRLEQEKVSSTQ
ncbi:methylmalonyl-CoA mutase [Flavobacterium sp. Sd200]|uniref:methylmalonyl-CoA mutase subunit beta n=1 Tax=Flavobacterium sp. Sd200 TaxID=2692211 RepID=UPI00136C12E5|nr:methylmalonyl-CoA mutase subunit beta [Flavobacterium sp. Sd200]MXN89826.1 methylmalonyl-CoA mutase [Flavobacterium sp. Sd200]